MSNNRIETGETVFTPTFQRLRESYFSNLLAEEKLRLEQELEFDDSSGNDGSEENTNDEETSHGILNKVFFFFQKKISGKDEVSDEEKSDDVLFFDSSAPVHEHVKIRLIGQIQAFLEETNKYHPRDERVIVIHFENVQLGMGYINNEIVFVIGFHKTIPMNLIRDQMHTVVEGMIQLYGPQVLDIRSCDGMNVKGIIEQIGREFVPLIHRLQTNVLSLFHPISYFPLPYKHNSIFLKASQLLERFHRINPFSLDQHNDEQQQQEEEGVSSPLTSSSNKTTGYLGGAIVIGGEQLLCRTIPEEVLHWMLVRVQNIGKERLEKWNQKRNVPQQSLDDDVEEEEENEGEDDDDDDDLANISSISNIEKPSQDIEEEDEQTKEPDSPLKRKEPEIDEEQNENESSTQENEGSEFDDLPPLEKLPTPPTPTDESEASETFTSSKKSSKEADIGKVRSDVNCITRNYCCSIHTMTPFVQQGDPIMDGNGRAGEGDDSWMRMQNAFPKLKVFHNRDSDAHEGFLPPKVLVQFGNIRIHYSFAYVSRDGLEGMRKDVGGNLFNEGGPNEENLGWARSTSDQVNSFLKENGFSRCLWDRSDRPGGSYVFCVIIQLDTISLLRLYDLTKLTQFTDEKKRSNEAEFNFALQKLFGLKSQIERILRESDMSDFQFIQHQGIKVKNLIGGKPRSGVSIVDPLQMLSPEKEKAKSLVQNIVHQRTRSGSGVVPPKVLPTKGESIMVFDSVSKILEGNFTEKKKKSFLPKLCMIHNHFENSGIHKIVLKNSKEVIYGKKVFDHEVFYVKETRRSDDESLTDLEKKVKEKVREEFKINIM